MLDFLVNATLAFYIDHFSTLFFYSTLAEMNIWENIMMLVPQLFFYMGAI